MAEESESGQEKSESPTEERRDEFRKRGEVVISRELNSVLSLIASITMLTFVLKKMMDKMVSLFKSQFEHSGIYQVNEEFVFSYLKQMWEYFLQLVIPIFSITAIVSMIATFGQSRLNVSFEKVKPNFGRMNLLSGMKKMVSGQAFLELIKSIAKMLVIGFIAVLILYGEWHKIPAFISVGIGKTWTYWLGLTKQLFVSVSCLLIVVAGFDYFYSYQEIEKRMKMTKQEVKEEYKQREVDPMLRNRMRRMARELLNKRTVAATSKATVIITNPTHFAIALKYELGMPAPIILAKGADLIALRMREIAKDHDIPIVENKPLARTLYKIGELNKEIPSELFKAVSEVIRYVFKIKGISLAKKQRGAN